MTRPWWSSGVRFECRMSGKCCVSRGEYGHVWAADVAAFCPGVGHGRSVPAAEIRAAIDTQRRAEAEDD